MRNQAMQPKLRLSVFFFWYQLNGPISDIANPTGDQLETRQGSICHQPFLGVLCLLVLRRWRFQCGEKIDLMSPAVLNLNPNPNLDSMSQATGRSFYYLDRIRKARRDSMN